MRRHINFESWAALERLQSALTATPERLLTCGKAVSCRQ